MVRAGIQGFTRALGLIKAGSAAGFETVGTDGQVFEEEAVSADSAPALFPEEDVIVYGTAGVAGRDDVFMSLRGEVVIFAVIEDPA